MNKRIVGKENFTFHNLNLFLFWLDRAAGLRPMKEGLLLTWVQCDQIGWFLKVLDDMDTIKSSPNAWWSIGLKWKATLSCGYIFANFWKNFGVLFNLASGHSCWRDLYRPLKHIDVHQKEALLSRKMLLYHCNLWPWSRIRPLYVLESYIRTLLRRSFL